MESTATCFCLLKYYLSKYQQNWTIVAGVMTQKPLKNEPCMDADLVRRTLKIVNLTTTNGILMKLNTIA